MIIKTSPSKEIYDFLNSVAIVNENIIGIMENEVDAEIYVDSIENPRGVLIRYEYFNYIYTEDDNFLDEVLEAYFTEGFYGFSGVYRPLAEKIRQRYTVNWESRCTLYYLPKYKLDLGLICHPVQPIDLKDAETVNEFYTFRNPGSIKKIQNDLKYRPSSAVYVNGEPACWVLVHNDNSMGIMYTREEHRKKGYAVDVTLDLADKIIKSGKTPFLQIREDNSLSPGLAAKCGFEKIGYADWFGIIAGTPKELIECNDRGREELLEILGGAEKFKSHGVLDCMYLPINLFKSDFETVEGFEVRRVEDKKGAALWCDTLVRGLELEGDMRESFHNRLLDAAGKKENNLELYLGMTGEIPVSTTAMKRIDYDTWGMYFISVIPEYRSHNMIKASVIESIQRADNREFECLMLQSTEEMVESLKELGFVHSHYIWENRE